MLLDWFTVCAQLLNFLLLVWLLKRYLYRPILDAIAQREQLIAKQLQDAEQQKAEAERERLDYEARNLSFEAQRDTQLRAALEDVSQQRQALLSAARAEADALRTGFRQKLESERLAWEQELTRRAQVEVFALAQRVLRDLADARLEDQIIQAFLRLLKDLPAADRDKLKGPENSQSQLATIRTSFDLDEAQRTTIQSALSETLGGPISATFETGREILCGIEVLANSHKVGWSIGNYLAEAERTAQMPVGEGIVHGKK